MHNSSIFGQSMHPSLSNISTLLYDLSNSSLDQVKIDTLKVYNHILGYSVQSCGTNITVIYIVRAQNPWRVSS
jgi:hypothetical protein